MDYGDIFSDFSYVGRYILYTICIYIIIYYINNTGNHPAVLSN